jgi:hypothetical protein
MLSHVWSSAEYEHWKAISTSIKGLLEDEQGLSMGVCWRSISVNQEQWLHFGLGFEIQLTRD